MRVILTHEHADFDAVASQLGAWKLDPTAVPILPQRLNRNVYSFVTTHAARLPFRRRSEVERRSVDHATVVDTQGVVQVRGMKPQTEVRLIDHHPLGRELTPGMTFEGEEVGACATLFVEQIDRQGLAVTAVEATLLLLGIYEDTGALTYGNTTPRDARAVAWLLERGADLDDARQYLHHPLSHDQRDLLDQLTRSAQLHNFGSYAVVVAMARVDHTVNEISTLAHRLRDLFDPDAVFVIVAMEDRVHLVARSNGSGVDVGQIARHFGGGGHSRAAAALLRDADLRQVHRDLLAVLAELMPPPTVASIMSRGVVRTVKASDMVASVADLMGRFGHEGFPVLGEAGQVVGVITRRDIDRAMRHGFETIPVSTYMRKGPITVAPDDTLEHLQRVMLDFDVGQAPVVEDGKLVGIVTRTDLLKHQAGRSQPLAPNPALAERFEARLTPAAREVISQASAMAGQLGYGLYVVGGFVRDLLLDAPRVATDIDLVVEGDAHVLVEALVQAHGGEARYHRTFGTAHWTPADPDQPPLDFVTARTEFYTEPTALPTVAQSSIKLDLHRRDFTINTMALALYPDHYGALLDFYGGQEDLRRAIIRVLHSLSLVEDPTRILRAVRLEQRLGFEIEPRTLELVDDALPLLERTSGDRIRHEFYRILEEPGDVPSRGLRRLEELGVLTYLHPDLHWTPAIAARLAAAQQTPLCMEPRPMGPALAAEDARALLNPVPAPYSLALLAYDLDASDIEALALTLKLSRADTALLREMTALRSFLHRLREPRLANSALVALLEPFSAEALCLFTLVEPDALIKARIEYYQATLAHVKPTVNGHHLRALGLPPGRAYRRILARLRDARLDGEIVDEAEERELAARLVAEEKESGLA